MPLTKGRYQGPLYRALNPVYARQPLSGRGARLYGGRFNPKGVPALYTAFDPATALREAKLRFLAGERPLRRQIRSMCWITNCSCSAHWQLKAM